jgi:hypothetical protein
MPFIREINGTSCSSRPPSSTMLQSPLPTLIRPSLSRQTHHCCCFHRVSLHHPTLDAIRQRQDGTEMAYKSYQQSSHFPSDTCALWEAYSLLEFCIVWHWQYIQFVQIELYPTLLRQMQVDETLIQIFGSFYTILRKILMVDSSD